ncbi:hypothetical protein LRE75_36410 [Streptomyces sp. 372A]
MLLIRAVQYGVVFEHELGDGAADVAGVPDLFGHGGLVGGGEVTVVFAGPSARQAVGQASGDDVQVGAS